MKRNRKINDPRRQQIRQQQRKNLRRKRLLRYPNEKISEAYQKYIVLPCPEILSLERNFDSTIDFFIKIKKLSRHCYESKNYKFCKYRPIFTIDLDLLNFISIRCAVILTAEIDRLRSTINCRLEYRGNIDNTAMSSLFYAGFFDYFDIKLNGNKGDNLNSTKHLLPLISGKLVDLELLDVLEQKLQQFMPNFSTSGVIYEAMAEAITNVKDHAYREDLPLLYPTYGKKWWATACYDEEKKAIRLFVYDQGHGIANTIPSSSLYENIEKIMARITINSQSFDLKLVHAALEYGKTSTQLNSRGKGFHNIMDVNQKIEGAVLRIASGKVELTLEKDNVTKENARPCHIGGTLLEWNIPFSGFKVSNGAKYD